MWHARGGVECLEIVSGDWPPLHFIPVITAEDQDVLEMCEYIIF